MKGNEIVEITITSCDDGKIARVGLGIKLADYEGEMMPAPIYALQELFRSVLGALDMRDEYRLDIHKREASDGLPH